MAVTMERFAGSNHDIPRPEPASIPPALAREIPFRVVVVAEGAITPLGNSADETWESYKAMRTGIATRFYHPYTEPTLDGEGKELAEAQIRAITAGTVKDFDPIKALVTTGVMPRKEVCFKTSPYSYYALAAAYEALAKVKTTDGTSLIIPRLKEDGSLDKQQQWVVNSNLVHPLHFVTLVGTGFGGGAVSSEVFALLKAGLIPSGDHMMRSLSDRAASLITQAFGLNGGAEADTAACASSGKATINGILRIAAGISEVGLFVGTEGLEAPIKWEDTDHESEEENPITAAEFDALGALDRGLNPLKVSRSLHKDRRGFTIAEGSVAFVVAHPEWARRHGITPLYEIVGFGDTSGAGTNTDPNTRAQEEAMRFARRRAGLEARSDGKTLVSGHFTGTWVGEISEMFATQNVLEGEQGNTIIVASKRLAGHMLGAAGNLSQLVAGKALQEGIIPGMPFDGEIMDEAYGWDIPLETRLEPDLTNAVVNQFGFGDANVSTWLRRTC